MSYRSSLAGSRSCSVTQSSCKATLSNPRFAKVGCQNRSQREQKPHSPSYSTHPLAGPLGGLKSDIYYNLLPLYTVTAEPSARNAEVGACLSTPAKSFP